MTSTLDLKSKKVITFFFLYISIDRRHQQRTKIFASAEFYVRALNRPNILHIYEYRSPLNAILTLLQAAG